MKTIRHNVFETNSSSTHSISIESGTEGIYETIIPDENGTITLTGGEFGWNFDKFSDALTKANYVALDNQDNPDKLSMLKELIIEHTGALEVIFNLEGYIDHQSVGTSQKAMNSKQSLKNFIFSEESTLFTGNDNEDAPPGFFKK